MTLVKVVRVQRGDKVGGEDLVSVPLFEAEVKRRPLEFRTGQLGDVFGDAIEGRVSFADQRPAGMVHNPPKGQGANIVDPLDWRLRVRDHIFPILVVEIAVLH